MKYLSFLLLCSSLLLPTGCKGTATESASASPQKTPATQPAPVSSVSFNADSAYHYVARQLDFGPRVPGTDAQQQCAAWLEAELSRHGAKVYVQRTEVRAFDDTRLPAINLIGAFNPEAKERVLLVAHWDSRPWADHDPDPARRKEPVMAANDGASGVGVLLEIARLAGQSAPRIGIDIFLTDVEDYGAPDSWKGQHRENHWGLGTQAWCRRPHIDGYTARYGILLDMVGAADATFYREYFSERYASAYVDLIWKTAAGLGYSDLFIDERGGGITDDHVFINRMLGIPTVDIIDTRPEGESSFYPGWHTTHDTLDQISKETLRKVGHVITKLLLN